MSTLLRADAIDRVLAQVRAITPVDDREFASLTATEAFLTTATDPFDEDADVTHVTASAFVVSSRGVILHQHRLLGRWFQPGGHVDPGESPEAAAQREVREETGLVTTPLGDGAVFHVDVHAGPHGHTHHDLRYILVAAPDDPSPAPGESELVAWFGFDAATARAEPELTAVLHKLTGVVELLPRETLGA